MSSRTQRALGIVTAYAIGALLGGSILLAGLGDPATIIGGLDFFGAFDPSLHITWLGTFVVAAPGYRILGLRKPLFAERSQLPCRRDLEPRLVTGSALFGVGWGLAGLCPGPTLTGLATGLPHLMHFAAAMALGMALYELVSRRRSSTRSGWTDRRSAPASRAPAGSNS